jgi:catechol 2,3-dioxygenase-like lactoylglutathione lyase family enzyme
MPIGATRIFHVNVNCSDLSGSLAFYRDLVGLVPTTHTVPPPQPGAAFALPTAQWDAWILTDRRGYDGVALDLLEWKTPAPTGRPYATPAHLGLARLGIQVRDLDALYDRLGAANIDCVGPPHPVELGGQVVARAFVAADPDGTLVEFTAGDDDSLSFVVVNCSDLDQSVRFYTETVGLHVRYRIGPVRHRGADLGLDGTVEWKGAVLDDGRDGDVFHLLVVETLTHRPPDSPYPSANHLGIFRLAMITEDIDRDYAELEARGVRCWSPPSRLAMGPGLPDLRALLFADPDGATLELIESPAPSV